MNCTEELKANDSAVETNLPVPKKQKHNSKRRKKKLQNNSVHQCKIKEISGDTTFVVKNDKLDHLLKNKIKSSTEKEVSANFTNTHCSSESNEIHTSSLSSVDNLTCSFQNLQVRASRNNVKLKERANLNLKEKISPAVSSENEVVSEQYCNFIQSIDNDCITYTLKSVCKDEMKNNNPRKRKKNKMRVDTPEHKEVVKSVENQIFVNSNNNEFTKVSPIMPTGNKEFKYSKSINSSGSFSNAAFTLKNNAISNKFFKQHSMSRRTLKYSNEICQETEEFDGRQKVFLNSSLIHKRVLSEEAEKSNNQHNTQQSTSKKMSKLKRENRSTMDDTAFPKYLSENELEKVGRLGLLLSGIIRINQKNFTEAYISAPDKGLDILIEGLFDRNRALEGDEVYYILKNPAHFRTSSDTGEVQRTAIVVGIKTRNHNRSTIACLQPPVKNTSFAIFLPRDHRVPRIRIKKIDCPPEVFKCPQTFKDRLFHVKINDWSDIRFADGIVLQEVGVKGDIESETSSIMLMYDLDEQPYPDNLRCYFPKVPFTIPLEEITCRNDFRSECVFTIDPSTAKDLDDALSFKILPNGNFKVGVHIADVTYFLHEGTPLDEAVRKRATTTYLVQKTYPMLPPELCDMCSLNSGEDKLTFSVIWELSPAYDVVNCHFTRSVINSCVKFSYDQVQDILDGCENIEMPIIHGEHNLNFIVDAIKSLNKIAIHFRRKRFANGALRIDQMKINFLLDEYGLPKDYFVYINKDSHRLIEEFMLLANIAVAERINSCFSQIAFLRSHSPPVPYMMRKLKAKLENHGIFLDISTSMSLHSSLMQYHGSDQESNAKMMVLNTLLAKPMARARYFCANLSSVEDSRHYALNVPLYTHFTSPIRRYADIMVHRLLAASLGYTETPKWTPAFVEKIAENCNKQKYSAKMAGEKSTELYLSLYMSQLLPFVCDAVVCDVKDKSFDCIILENGYHQRVYFESYKGKSTVIKENGVLQLKVLWPKTENDEETVQVIQIFSIVKIELKKSKELQFKAKLVQNTRDG